MKSIFTWRWLTLNKGLVKEAGILSGMCILRYISTAPIEDLSAWVITFSCKIYHYEFKEKTVIVDVGKDAKMRRRTTVILIFIHLFIRTCTLDPSALVSHCCTCDRIVLQFCSDPSKCRVIVTVLPWRNSFPRKYCYYHSTLWWIWTKLQNNTVTCAAMWDQSRRIQGAGTDK